MLPKPENTIATKEGYITEVATQTVAEVKSAIFLHECGQFSASSQLADLLGRNTRIAAAIDTRCKGVVALPFSLEPADDSKEAKRYADEVTEFWWDRFPEALLSDMLRGAVPIGFQPGELTFDIEEKRWMPRLHPWHTCNWEWSDQETKWLAYTGDSKILHITPGDGQWWMAYQSPVRPWMRGIVRCLGLEDTIRSLAVTDWARWCERHGIPIAIAEIPEAQITTDAGKAFASDVRTMGSKGVVRIPTGDPDAAKWGLSLLEPKTLSSNGFRELINLVDRDVSIAILGQTLTTEVTGGSLAAAQVHELVRQDYIRSDTRMLETMLRMHVLKFYMLYNHGPESVVLTPWPKWDTRRPGQMLEQANTLKAVGDAAAAIKAAWPNVDMQALAARFEIELSKSS